MSYINFYYSWICCGRKVRWYMSAYFNRLLSLHSFYLHLISYIFYNIYSNLFDMNSIFWMTTQHWRQWVQQELLRSQGPHPTQDSDLAFNSTPLPQAQRPGFQPWPLTSAWVSLGSTPTEGWTRGHQAGSTGGLCMDATLPTPNCHTNDSCCIILEDSISLISTLIYSS